MKNEEQVSVIKEEEKVRVTDTVENAHTVNHHRRPYPATFGKF